MQSNFGLLCLRRTCSTARLYSSHGYDCLIKAGRDHDWTVWVFRGCRAFKSTIRSASVTLHLNNSRLLTRQLNPSSHGQGDLGHWHPINLQSSQLLPFLLIDGDFLLPRPTLPKILATCRSSFIARVAGPNDWETWFTFQAYDKEKQTYSDTERLYSRRMCAPKI